MVSNEMSNAQIIRSEIVVDASINSRKNIDPKKIDKLRDNIKQQGLIHPCLVIRSSQVGKKYSEQGPYLLVAGFRRQQALDLIAEEKQLPAAEQKADYRVAPPDWTLEDAIMANLSENLSREDLTTYELAMQCAELKAKYKLGAVDIAKRVKAHDCEVGDRKPLSEGHINNLIRCATSLHPDILTAWREGHPKASIMTLIKLAAEKDEAKQLDMWNGVERGGADEDEEEGGSQGGGSDTEKTPARRPTSNQIAIAIELVKGAVKEGKKTDDWGKGAIVALQWAAGVKAYIPGIKTAEKEE